jgi:hypothetical protein
MFRRMKSAGDEPVANQLRITNEPNVLKSDKPGKTNTTDWAWTPDGIAADLEPGEDEFETGDDLDGESAGDEDSADKTDDRTPAQRRADLEAELQRQAEEFGLTGDNPIGLYGPNGEEVAALLDSLPDIDDETAEAIADAYEAIPEAERRVAQSVVRRRHRGGKMEYEISLAERAVTDWISSLKLTDRDDVALYAIVADAATDAVDALVLEDELADADFATLYGAWSEVMDEEDDGTEAADETEATEGAAEQVEEAAEAVDEGPFGPNSELVIKFLNRLGKLDGSMTAALVAAWREQPKEELKVAHRAMQSLADEDATWREQLRLAQEEIFAWMENQTTKYFEYGQNTKDDTRARELAGPAVADAIAALVMADILEPEEAETLYAPWAEVVSEPELPKYEDEAE